ncbi:biotin/lipoyl-binding protein [Chromobacterium vaccinii]|uniref:biotin/lipoyl-binding protein n=1 Tax=Chromobacterium vaccinii TaxID=1108595 RepID=UPI000E202030|nr:biotin/lipoyl-binding protein [Chromobacterium vaccinii]
MDNEKKKQQVPRQLFRSEALNHAYNRAYGNIVLAKPTSFAWLTCFFTVITLIIILFLLTFSYTRKAQVTGVLLPTLGLIRVIPPQDGLVSEVLVKEGESVHAGQILFVISNEHASEANGEVIKTITSLLQARRSSLANDQELIRLQANQN